MPLQTQCSGTTRGLLFLLWLWYTHVMSRYRGFIFIAASVFVLPIALLPHANADAQFATTQFQTQRAYSGCFERSIDQAQYTITVFMKQPSCRISITNPDTQTPAIHNLHIINLDPHFYEVIDDTGAQISTQRAETAIDFTVTIPTDQTITHTIRLWEDTSDNTDFWFAAVSDTQTQDPNVIPNPITVEMMDYLELISPPFVTNSGDVIGGEKDANAHEFQYELYDEMFQDFSGSHFPVPGDHDTMQDLNDYYKRFFGDTRFTFTYGDTRFIGVNSVETLDTEGRFSEDTFTWLEEVFANNTHEQVIVTMQHPLVPPPWANSSGIDEDQRLRIGQLFVNNGVDLIIVGDAHGYDHFYVDGDDIDGLTGGGVYQLDAAGAGGKFFTYTGGEHYFTLVHVTPTGITHAKLDYTAVNLEVEYETPNDGSTNEARFTVKNSGEVTIPYVRAKVVLSVVASEHLYALTSRGEVLPVVSDIVEGVRRGAVELAVNPGEDIAVTVKELTSALQGPSQRVVPATPTSFSPDARLSIQQLPVQMQQETGLFVTAAITPATLDVETWNTEAQRFQWNIKTRRNNTLDYRITELHAHASYDVVVNDRLVNRIMADETGSAEFALTAPRGAPSIVTLSLAHQTVPTRIGVLPQSKGGAQLQTFSNEGELLHSSFVYQQSLIHGFESRWIQIDADEALEFVTVPTEGAVSQLKLFDDTGTLLDVAYPFGNGFRGGLTVTVGDIDGDGLQECIVAPASEQRPIVYVYAYIAAEQELRVLDLFEVYDRSYTSGVNMATGDLDGNGADELIVGPRESNKHVVAYQYTSDTNQLTPWISEGLPVALREGGVTIVAGDFDFTGDDEFVLSSFSNSSQFVVYEYAAAENDFRSVATATAFDARYTGGVDLLTGNIDEQLQDELLVIPRGAQTSAALAAFSWNSAGGLKRLAQVAPLRQNTGGLHATVVDYNEDQRVKVVLGGREGGGTASVFRYNKSSFVLYQTLHPYAASFRGGLLFTY